MDWLDKHMPEGKRIRNELNSNVLTFITAHERAQLLHRHNIAYLKYLEVPSWPEDATPEELAHFIKSEDTRHVIAACMQRKLKQIFRGHNETTH